MNIKIPIQAFLIYCLATAGCTKADDNPEDKIHVVINDIPYKTDKYTRIGYTVKLWEYEKEGLRLEKISILDMNSQSELLLLGKSDIEHIYKDPLAQNPYFKSDKIDGYYTSIQIPVPLDKTVPSYITHRIYFTDTVRNKEVIVNGGTFPTRKSEEPVVINSPVKGSNWLFINQSTLGYHFYAMFFTNGTIGTGERYAFDNLRIDEDGNFFSGDPARNESYFNYKDTLYAVADGRVAIIKDGRPENLGNTHSVTMPTADELGGNYIMIDIGRGRYAIYAHCVPGSFMVMERESVKEGDPIALLGNSGNSDAPHLHFQICDKPEFFFTRGLSFVLKEYKNHGEFGSDFPKPPVVIKNAMMEELTVISFD